MFVSTLRSEKCRADLRALAYMESKRAWCGEDCKIIPNKHHHRKHPEVIYVQPKVLECFPGQKQAVGSEACETSYCTKSGICTNVLDPSICMHALTTPSWIPLEAAILWLRAKSLIKRA